MQIEKITKTLILPFCVIVTWIMLAIQEEHKEYNMD